MDEWGSGASRGRLVGADGVPQSEQLKGVWLNRCEAGSIRRIVVNQGTGTRANALYDVLVEETGNWDGGVYYPSSMSIDHIEARNITGSSRGISFGDTAYAAGDLAVFSRAILPKVSTAKAAISGAGAGGSLNEKCVVTCDVLRFNVDTFDALFLKTSTARLSARLIDLGIHKYRGVYAAGKVVAGEVRRTRTSSGGGVSTVELIAGAEAAPTSAPCAWKAAPSSHTGGCTSTPWRT